MAVHGTEDPGTQGAEAEGLLRVGGQSGLQSEYRMGHDYIEKHVNDSVVIAAAAADMIIITATTTPDFKSKT